MSDRAIALRLEDLLPIYSGLCAIPGVIAEGRIQRANEQLGVIRDYAKVCRIAADNAHDRAKSEADRDHFLSVHNFLSAVCRLVDHAVHKITTGRAAAADAQLVAARDIARAMMQITVAREGQPGGSNALH